MWGVGAPRTSLECFRGGSPRRLAVEHGCHDCPCIWRGDNPTRRWDEGSVRCPSTTSPVKGAVRTEWARTADGVRRRERRLPGRPPGRSPRGHVAATRRGGRNGRVRGQSEEGAERTKRASGSRGDDELRGSVRNPD